MSERAAYSTVKRINLLTEVALRLDTTFLLSFQLLKDVAIAYRGVYIYIYHIPVDRP